MHPQKTGVASRGDASTSGMLNPRRGQRSAACGPHSALRGYTGAEPPCEMLVLALQFSRCDQTRAELTAPEGRARRSGVTEVIG